MNINDFLGISIVGTCLSLVIQYLKEKHNIYGFDTKIITITLAILVGAGYWFLSDTAIWESVLGVLAAASTVYALFIKE